MNKDILEVINQQEVLGKEFRIYGTFENPLFLAKDVAEWIDYTQIRPGTYNVSAMLNKIDDEEKLVSTIMIQGQNREMWFLTEDGLYEVLMQSRKPIAKQFKKKVKKILKGLRKGELSLQKTRKEELILGLYNSNGGQEAVMISKELVVIEVEEATKPLIDTIDILKPIADYTINVLNPSNAIKLLTVTDISKDLGMSAQALNLKLHKLGVQYKRGGYWKFYSKYDYLIPEYADYVIDEYGQYLKWTEKGRQWIIEFLEKNDKKED